MNGLTDAIDEGVGAELVANGVVLERLLTMGGVIGVLENEGQAGGGAEGDGELCKELASFQCVEERVERPFFVYTNHEMRKTSVLRKLRRDVVCVLRTDFQLLGRCCDSGSGGVAETAETEGAGEVGGGWDFFWFGWKKWPASRGGEAGVFTQKQALNRNQCATIRM